jgi:hypothetical protein
MTTLIIAAAGATLLIVGIAAYATFRDPDGLASHRRAMRRAGLTFIGSAPEARTKPKPYSRGATRSVSVTGPGTR